MQLDKSFLGVTSKKKSIFKDIIQIKVDHPPSYPIFDKLPTEFLTKIQQRKQHFIIFYAENLTQHENVNTIDICNLGCTILHFFLTSSSLSTLFSFTSFCLIPPHTFNFHQAFRFFFLFVTTDQETFHTLLYLKQGKKQGSE